MQHVDLEFSLVGDSLPLDHGYPLYGAISRTVPGVHEHAGIGVHPIGGQAVSKGELLLTRNSFLRIRTRLDWLPELLSLTGKQLNIDGHTLRVGVPCVREFKPSGTLGARMVTIKGFLEPEKFLEAVGRQTKALGFSDRVVVRIPESRHPQSGVLVPLRRVMRIKERTIVGFGLQVTGLSEEESLRLQEEGLGGRRHMGCGIFKPVRGD